MDNVTCTDPGNDGDIIIKTYKYRWVILSLYGLTMACNSNLASNMFNIADAVGKYYDVSDSVLMLASTIGNIVCAISFVPGIFIPSKYGLRFAVIIGTAANGISGAFLIAAGQESGYYWFLMSQCFIGFSTGIMYQLATEVSAVWFPAHEHVLATNLSMIMMICGSGIGYLQNILLFNGIKSMSTETFQSRLNIMIYSLSGLSTLSFFLSLLYFKDMPQYPPSISQAERSGPGEISYADSVHSIKNLLKNSKYCAIAIIFALNLSFCNTYATIVNLMITPFYDNGETLVGIVGVASLTSGFIGTILFSVILDKTHQYKAQLLFQLVASSALFIAGTEFLLLQYPFYLVCCLSAAGWFFFLSTTGIIAEIVSEITYPINSSTSFAMCALLGTILTTILTQASAWFADRKQVNVLCWLMIGTIVLQVLILIAVPVKLKRNLHDKNLLNVSSDVANGSQNNVFVAD